MFEFTKLCSTAESLSSPERVLLLAEKSAAVVSGLGKLNLPGIDPIDTIICFIVGSVVSDGVISEKDYLYIYPTLVKTFGETHNIAEIKYKLKISKDIQKDIKNFTKQLHDIIASVDENLGADIVMLCLLLVSADGKISLKERQYIRQLCK